MSYIFLWILLSLFFFLKRNLEREREKKNNSPTEGFMKTSSFSWWQKSVCSLVKGEGDGNVQGPVCFYKPKGIYSLNYEYHRKLLVTLA